MGLAIRVHVNSEEGAPLPGGLWIHTRPVGVHTVTHIDSTARQAAPWHTGEGKAKTRMWARKTRPGATLDPPAGEIGF